MHTILKYMSFAIPFGQVVSVLCIAGPPRRGFRVPYNVMHAVYSYPIE